MPKRLQTVNLKLVESRAKYFISLCPQQDGLQSLSPTTAETCAFPVAAFGLLATNTALRNGLIPSNSLAFPLFPELPG